MSAHESVELVRGKLVAIGLDEGDVIATVEKVAVEGQAPEYVTIRITRYTATRLAPHLFNKVVVTLQGESE